MHVSVLNGPNLNLLGTREPELYGHQTLSAIEAAVRDRANEQRVTLSWHQTSGEGAFVELVQGLAGEADGALINAAAYTHTSLAIRDALAAVRVPFVEVHLSNVYAREQERRHSVMADLALGVVAGFGWRSYVIAFDGLVTVLRDRGR